MCVGQFDDPFTLKMMGSNLIRLFINKDKLISSATVFLHTHMHDLTAQCGGGRENERQDYKKKLNSQIWPIEVRSAICNASPYRP